MKLEWLIFSTFPGARSEEWSTSVRGIDCLFVRFPDLKLEHIHTKHNKKGSDYFHTLYLSAR